jgi:opacity protein-like surface antigen
MKKLLAIFTASLLLAKSAQATGFYVGVDALQASSKSVVKNYSAISDLKNGGSKKDNSITYGANAGFRLDVLNLLAAAELFYDDINISAKNFESADAQKSSSNRSNLKNRYGAKANVGFAILPRITPFLTYGLTSVNYSSKALSNNNSFSKSQLTPLYGIGLLVDLPFGISAKASYDYQQLKTSFAGEGAKIKTNLGVAKIGVIYNF